MERKKDEVRGDTLRALRKKRKLTQQEVADYLGLSKQAISKFEQGYSYSLETAFAFAKFYGVTYDYLIANTKVGKYYQPIIDKLEERNETYTWVMRLLTPRLEALEKRVEELELEAKSVE